MMEIYVTYLLQILSFSSLFRRFEMKSFLRRPAIVANNISQLVVSPRIFFISTCLEKLKIADNEFQFYIKITGFFNISIRNKWKCISLFFYFMTGFLWSLDSHIIFLCISILLGLIKRRSKAQEKNISCQRALNFDQLKKNSGNYKPMRVSLWLAYKFTENYCRLRIVFIQTKKRYLSSFDKMRILTWKLLVISS